ncbi:MAG TPA: hypothetical protein VE243_07935, partial [Candidatus Acidoferrum sp.]|nr:hypothetical protein [Candidatus Acidoferrum sp.]
METRAMRHVVVALAVSALIASSGCGRGPHPGPPPLPGGPFGPKEAAPESHNVVANSFFGSAEIKETADFCAGRIQLAQGAATVNDACFTGDTNVVLCTDASSANAVQCAASNGKLVLAGT